MSVFNKPGEYYPVIKLKGKQDTDLEGVNEGDVFWEVVCENKSILDVKTQTEAEIVSRLVRIEKLLKGKKQ
jgi:hypothetical protein